MLPWYQRLVDTLLSVCPFPLLWVGCLVHLWQGCAVLLEPTARQITPLALLAHWPAWVYGPAILGTVVCAAVALLRRRVSPELRLLLLAPQQGLMFLGSLGGMVALWHGYYGDHAVYPRGFIGPDQAMSILVGFAHLYAVLLFARRLP